MTGAETLAVRLSDLLPHTKPGTLRIWGDWFGRPYDNIHTITGVEARGDTLVVFFDQGETLTIYEPKNAEFDRHTFRVAEASRVRWEWHLYGRDRSTDNFRFRDYILGPDGWTMETNFLSAGPPNQPIGGPAAELL